MKNIARCNTSEEIKLCTMCVDVAIKYLITNKSLKFDLQSPVPRKKITIGKGANLLDEGWIEVLATVRKILYSALPGTNVQ